MIQTCVAKRPTCSCTRGGWDVFMLKVSPHSLQLQSAGFTTLPSLGVPAIKAEAPDLFPIGRVYMYCNARILRNVTPFPRLGW